MTSSPRIRPPWEPTCKSESWTRLSGRAVSGLTLEILLRHRLALARVLRSLDFFLDLGADSTFPSDIDVEYSDRRTPPLHSQYIHRSGTVLVSIFPDEDDPAEPGRLAFACSPNRIWTSHHPELDSQEPLRRLREVCADAPELQRLYGELGQGST